MEPRERYITINSATGEFSKHHTRGQATLAFLKIMDEIDCQAPRPQILEWAGNTWRLL